MGIERTVIATSGTVGTITDADIPAAIARDAEVTTALAAKVDLSKTMLNARHNGVAGDGSRTDPTVGTNDATAITTLLATAATTGGTAYFPRGVYHLTGSVTFPAGGNFGIQGDGPGATIFQLDGTTNTSIIFNLSNVATANPNVRLRGFTLDGDKSHMTARGGTGINLRCCDNLEVSDVEVRNIGGKGIHHQGDAGLPVTDIQTWRRVYVHDCDGFFGIQATLRTRKTTWDQIYVENNTGVGIYLDVSEMVVRSIHAEGNYSHGIFIHNVYMCSFTGLHATRNGGSGIVVLGMVDSLGGNWLAQNNGKNFVNGTLSASPSSGATSISVAAGSNPAPVAGQFLTIGAPGSQETVHVKTVTGAGPYTCTLFAGTTAGHTSGDAVLSGRSAESDPVPTVCADIYFDADNTQNYGITKRSQVNGVVAGYTSIGAEGVKADYSLYMEDGVTTDVRVLDVTYPGAGRTATWRLPATLGSTFVYRHAPIGGTMVYAAGGPPELTATSAAPADHGYLGWTIDPLLASTTFVAASGTLYLARVRVQTTGPITAVHLPITTAAAGLTVSKVAVFSTAGTRLGVSADQGTAWHTGNAVKTVSLTSPTAIQDAGTVLLAGMVVVGTTGPTIRASVTAAGLNLNLTASSPGRAATLASQTDMPTSVTPSGTTLATQVPLLALA